MATGNTAGGVPTFEKLIRRPNTAPGPTPAPDRPPPVIEPPDEPPPSPVRDPSAEGPVDSASSA